MNTFLLVFAVEGLLGVIFLAVWNKILFIGRQAKAVFRRLGAINRLNLFLIHYALLGAAVVIPAERGVSFASALINTVVFSVVVGVAYLLSRRRFFGADAAADAFVSYLLITNIIVGSLAYLIAISLTI